MKARTVLRWLSGTLLVLGLTGLVFWIMDGATSAPVTSLTFIGLGFAGVVALFAKDVPSG